MNYSKALLLATMAILATFSPVDAMEKEPLHLPLTYTKNRRRVIDVEERAENDFQQPSDFLGNVSSSAGHEDNLIRPINKTTPFQKKNRQLNKK